MVSNYKLKLHIDNIYELEITLFYLQLKLYACNSGSRGLRTKEAGHNTINTINGRMSVSRYTRILEAIYEWRLMRHRFMMLVPIGVYPLFGAG